MAAIAPATQNDTATGRAAAAITDTTSPATMANFQLSAEIFVSAEGAAVAVVELIGADFQGQGKGRSAGS